MGKDTGTRPLLATSRLEPRFTEGRKAFTAKSPRTRKVRKAEWFVFAGFAISSRSLRLKAFSQRLTSCIRDDRGFRVGRPHGADECENVNRADNGEAPGKTDFLRD